MTQIRITRGQAAGPRARADGDLEIEDGRIIEPRPATSARLTLDARDLMVLPGIIDIHGDAFERQIEPRPRVGFDLDMALLETDRQLIANGITTAYHGVTWSWEPGLRGPENARALLVALERLAPRLAADTRYHLRQETFNLDGESEIIGWLAAKRLGCLAFNDHTTGTARHHDRPSKVMKMAERAGQSTAAMLELVDRVYARREEVPGSIHRLAAAARAAGVPLLSHDDMSIADRNAFRALGCRIAEFPTKDAIAEAAIAAGDWTVFGAPNVVRGGSHIDCPGAADMVARGWCSILASDYYYPALLAAPFRLVANGVATLDAAWQLVSTGPARALGLTDRGTLAPGQRADVILVDARDPRRPSVVAVVARGQLVHLTDGTRIGG